MQSPIGAFYYAVEGNLRYWSKRYSQLKIMLLCIQRLRCLSKLPTPTKNRNFPMIGSDDEKAGSLFKDYAFNREDGFFLAGRRPYLMKVCPPPRCWRLIVRPGLSICWGRIKWIAGLAGGLQNWIWQNNQGTRWLLWRWSVTRGWFLPKDTMWFRRVDHGCSKDG